MSMVRHVRRVMGTAVAITLPAKATDLVGAAFDHLAWVERTFSVFDPHSEISRIASGALALADAHPLVVEVLDRCEELEDLTNGWFRPRSPDRPLDPSGFVKGWAVDAVVDQLVAAGVESAMVLAGGDAATIGSQPGSTQGWRAGVRHPLEDGMIAVVELVDTCIATSGTYERGDHIWGAGGFASTTVVGPSLGTADALATALFADGGTDLTWTDRFGVYDSLVIRPDLTMGATAGMQRRLVDLPASGEAVAG